MADESTEKLQPLLADFLVTDGLRIQVIEVGSKSTTFMTCFEQFRDVWVVPGTISVDLVQMLVGASYRHHSGDHAFVLLAARHSSELFGDIDDIAALFGSSHCKIIVKELEKKTNYRKQLQAEPSNIKIRSDTAGGFADISPRVRLMAGNISQLGKTANLRRVGH